ncbi:MAG: hypothetical protein ABJO67_12450 [Pseudoruegeria sp.]
MSLNDHQSRTDFEKWNYELLKELGPLALRFLITLNAGGFVILLTFLGGINRNSQFVLPLQSLKFSLSLMLGSIVFAFLLLIVSYINAGMNSKGSPIKFLSNSIIGINALGALISILAFAFAVLALVLSFEIRT